MLDFELDSSRPCETIAYTISEAFNATLADLYFTNKNENMEFSEEQLVEIAF